LDNPERYSDDNFSLEDLVDEIDKKLCETMASIRLKDLDVQHNKVKKRAKRKIKTEIEDENYEEKDNKQTVEKSLKQSVIFKAINDNFKNQLHGRHFPVKPEVRGTDDDQGLGVLCILLLNIFAPTEILTDFYQRIFNAKRKCFTDGFAHFGIIFFQLQSSERTMKTNACKKCLSGVSYFKRYFITRGQNNYRDDKCTEILQVLSNIILFCFLNESALRCIDEMKIEKTASADVENIMS